MKKTTHAIILALSVLLLFTVFFAAGCATTVTVNHLIPAEINMSDYRNLAVASTRGFSFGFFNRPASIVPDLSGTSGYRVYSGLSPYAEVELAQYATRRLNANLANADYFSLISPALTDTIVGRGGNNATMYDQLLRAGASALLTSDISYMDVDEYIYAAEVKKLVTKDPITGLPLPKAEERLILTYFIKQRIAITYRYEIVDLRTGRLIISKTFNDQFERSYELPADKTKVITASSIDSRFESLVDNFLRTLTNQIAPRYERTVLSLMDNKPEVQRVAQAWEEAKRGNIAVARDLFLKEWTRSDHIPSGYNAALMIEALGDLPKAVDLMWEVYRVSGSARIYSQLDRMKRALDNQRKAESQM